MTSSTAGARRFHQFLILGAFLAWSWNASAETVRVVASATLTQDTGPFTGSLIDPLGLEGAELRIVLQYDDSVAYDDLDSGFPGDASTYEYWSSTSIQYWFTDRPGGLADASFAPSWQSVFVRGSDQWAPANVTISTGELVPDFLGSGHATTVARATFDGLFSTPTLPDAATWANWLSDNPNYEFAWDFLRADLGVNDPDFFRYSLSAHSTAVETGDNLSPVPVPAAVWLFGSALAAAGAVRRKRQASI